MILRKGDKTSVCVESVGEEEMCRSLSGTFETRVLKTNFGAFVNDLPKSGQSFSIFWNARRKKSSKSMEISKMACGWNSVWTEIGKKNQRDPERGWRKEKYLADIEASLRG
ncbi:hypothetical protein AVEN_162155-1 [Araneus ventricosus]|uniref:Uncharacterized protein n=1 Tax=Araneus ventricosus TaxID=182803 RepID=A0A4Y2SGW5_ARAVE|nr:hypothetical protein AVEN_162155-1 [Araneus ventricosus]